MIKTRLAVAAGLAGIVTLFSASAANAYPDPQINVGGGSAADGVVAPGEEFTLSGDFGGTDCNPWVSTFNGTAGASGSGTTFSVTFTAPAEPGTYSVDITCTWDDLTDAEEPQDQPQDQALGGAVVVEPVLFVPTVLQTTVVSFPVSVQVAGDAGTDAGDGAGAGVASESDGNGILPDTGGNSIWYLVGGAALVAAGTGFVVSRRNAS